MLIKVKPHLFINTEHITAISFRFSDTDPTSEIARVFLYPSVDTDDIPGAVARGLLEFMEVNDSLIMSDRANASSMPNLKSQLAVALRDTWKGVTLAQLDAVFPHAGQDNIRIALQELAIERVIVTIPDPLDENAQPPYLIYHSSSSEAQTWMRTRYHTWHYTTNGTHSLCGFTSAVLTTIRSDVTCEGCRSIINGHVVTYPRPNPDPSAATAALPSAPGQAAECTGSTTAPKSEN